MCSDMSWPSSSAKMCKACNNMRTCTTPVGVDACQRCAYEAEIEYTVWKDDQWSRLKRLNSMDGW